MKIALCFIISYKHILNKEQLWINWIKENQDIINVYFHYKDINLIKSPWIKMYSIPPKYIQPTTYYNVVPAYMSLLSYAFHHDLENKWFCMLTDSCVPIVSPAKFRQMFFDNYRISLFSWKPAYWNINIHRRANLRLFKKEYWLANDPWFTLSRTHVHKCIIFIAAKNGIYQLVNEGGLANESIFAIMLQTFNELTNSDKLLNNVSTITDWTRMSSPTSPYLFKEATNENINIISNLLKENPNAMFLRKVDKSFPDQSILDLMVKLDDKNDSGCLVSVEYVVSIEQGYYMCIISLLTFLSSIYKIEQKLYIVSASTLIVFGTSINYWRKPIYGLRRNVDIFFVICSLSLHIYISLQSKDMGVNNYYYCYITIISILLYLISWLLYKKQYFWGSTIAHSIIHMISNLNNVLLYKRIL